MSFDLIYRILSHWKLHNKHKHNFLSPGLPDSPTFRRSTMPCSVCLLGWTNSWSAVDGQTYELSKHGNNRCFGKDFVFKTFQHSLNSNFLFRLKRSTTSKVEWFLSVTTSGSSIKLQKRFGFVKRELSPSGNETFSTTKII